MANVLLRKVKTAWGRYNPMVLHHQYRMSRLELEMYRLNQQFEPTYQVVSTDAFFAKKTSDTIFVFGAGASLQEVTSDEWRAIDQHNTIGWRLFVYQEYVHADYLLFREFLDVWQIFDKKYRTSESHRLMTQMDQNPAFDNTLIIIQAGQVALAGNMMIGCQFIPKRYPILRYYNGRRDIDAPPAETFEEGVAHVYGTLSDAVNMAYIGKWKEIVLIGVDLYDSAYFMMPPGQENPLWVSGFSDPTTLNSTAQSGIVNKMGEWATWLAARDIRLSVYNPKSLLTAVMPIYDRNQLK